MRRITSLLISVMMILSVAVPVLAVDADSAETQHEHSWSAWEEDFYADCSHTGQDYRWCLVCYEYEYRTTPKTSHCWEDYYVDKAATVFSAGRKVQFCENCLAERTVAIKKLKPIISWKKKVNKLQRTKSIKFKVKLAKGDYVKKWKSSKKKVATVTKTGVVKGKKKGKTKIIAYTASGLKITCLVKVVNPKKKKSAASGGGKVYWTPNGSVYHRTKYCSTLSRSKIIYSGTISQSGKSRGCKVCY